MAHEQPSQLSPVTSGQVVVDVPCDAHSVAGISERSGMRQKRSAQSKSKDITSHHSVNGRNRRSIRKVARRILLRADVIGGALTFVVIAVVIGLLAGQ
mmetsp:Transcript_61245/g.173063  ORF Transcript_61245/g.173063 Transcript_61245/m.173063 type:complete len:98 (-) Transcript_61245:390-683(-)